MKNNSINIENFGQYVEKKINDRLFVSNIFKIFEKEQNNSKNSIPYKNIMYCRRMGNTITVVFLCLLAMFCQRISFSVFGIAFACCAPVSCADVLAHFAFQAVCAVLQRQLSVFCWIGVPTWQGHVYTVPSIRIVQRLCKEN